MYTVEGRMDQVNSRGRVIEKGGDYSRLMRYDGTTCPVFATIEEATAWMSVECGGEVSTKTNRCGRIHRCYRRVVKV